VIYRVRHVTRYDYQTPVNLGAHLAHLRPRALPHQRVLRAGVHAAPAVSWRRDGSDHFGNDVTWLFLDVAHAAFQVIADATGVEAPWIVYGLVSREPSGTDSRPGVSPEAEKANRHLTWTLFEVWRFFHEEGIEPNWGEVVSFVHHIAAAAKDSPDDAHAKEAIARKLEAERAGLREDLEKVRKKRLNPKNPEFGS